MRVVDKDQSHAHIRHRCLVLVLLVAAINALCWAFLTPPFHGPDEHGQIAYIQYLAETGKLPGKVGQRQFSSEQSQALAAVNYQEVQVSLVGRPPFSNESVLSWNKLASEFSDRDRRDGGGETFATPNPPLFHSYQALVYRIAGGDIFNRLAMMRVASILLFLGTIAFTWALAGVLFERKLWPRVLASLSVALLPMVTYVLTSIHPDALLTFCYSGAIYFGVRLLIRGPTTFSLIGLGGFTGLAVMTKLVAPALLPAVLFAFAAIAWQVRGRWTKGQIARRFGLASGLIALPLIIWSVVYPALGRNSISRTVVDTVSGDDHGASLSSFFSFMWQWYLPKLPFMETSPQTLGVPAYNSGLHGFWGSFGPWLLLDYPEWLKLCLVGFTVGLIAMAALTLARRRNLLFKLWRPVVYIVLVVLALLFTINVVSYRAALVDQPFFQSRYVFPLISLFGVLVVLAVMAFKKLPGIIASALVVALLYVLNLFALAVNADRYYIEPGEGFSIAALPNIFHRAAQFGASWEGPWFYWLLFIALLAVPALAIVALKTALKADNSAESTAPSS